MIRTILVPLDGSPFAGQALTAAVALARRTGAAIDLLHVCDKPQHNGECGEERAYLERFVERLRTLDVKAEAHLRKGKAAKAIADFATEKAVDLLVLSTHGRGKVSQCWLGSVTDALVRKLPLPTLLIRPSHTPTDALGAELTLAKMLMPVDPEGAATCPQVVADVAKAMGGDVSVSAVVAPCGRPRFDWPQTSASDDTLEARKKAAQDVVDRTAEKLRAAGCRPRSEVVIAEPVPTSILDAVAKDSYDVVALGIRPANTKSGLFAGNVADKVVRGNTCATLLFRLGA